MRWLLLWLIWSAGILFVIWFFIGPAVLAIIVVDLWWAIVPIVVALVVGYRAFRNWQSKEK